MTKYHAVMIDETGCEFGVSVTAKSRSAAYDILREDYPECIRIDQLESPTDTRRREKRIYDQVNDAYWSDSDPFNYGDDSDSFYYGDEY